MIKHANFKLYRACTDRVVWKNRQLAANISANEFDYLFIKRSNEVCLKNNVLRRKSINSDIFYKSVKNHTSAIA